MMGAGLFAGVALGLGLGARHAFEPDHLAAVSVLVAEGRGARGGMLVGALWGAGHTAALLACGLGAALAASAIPPGLSDAFELLVAAMLVVLGGRALFAHAHGGPPAHLHVARRVVAVRPLVVGAVHGLAGSGALTALVMAHLPNAHERVAFMGLFGLGSIGGMCVVTGLSSWPLARLSRNATASRMVFGGVGAASAIFGVMWAWPPALRFLH